MNATGDRAYYDMPQKIRKGSDRNTRNINNKN